MAELKTKGDVVDLLLRYVSPLKKHYSDKKALLYLGANAAHYGELPKCVEGFSRVLWGIGPFLACDESELTEEQRAEMLEWTDIVRCGIVAGTNPGSGEYWGDLWDYDQKMVEMAAIVNCILLAKERIFDPMAKGEKERVITWLSQINEHRVHANNWRFFRILVNVLLIKLGAEYSQERLSEDLEVVEACYVDDGWYFDGNKLQQDYYIPFAMHYYGLIYSINMKSEDPERSELFLSRAEKFYSDFIYWFNESGVEVPFGRSLTYRFAHSAFFSALIFAGGKIDHREVKKLLLGNLEYWAEAEVCDNDGVLTVGYRYPNLFMSERYNAPGSPYWSLKTFLILAVPASDDFWKEEPKPVSYDPVKVLRCGGMVSTHEQNGHVLLYIGYQRSGCFGNTDAKYGKFVYSNQFGFSVARGNTLEEGAFDSALVASMHGDGFYRMRRELKDVSVCAEHIESTYELMPGVMVRSVIYPTQNGHRRVHYVKTEIPVDMCDGGFAFPIEKGFERIDSGMVSSSEKLIEINFPWAEGGVICSDKFGKAENVTAFPNTSLMFPLTMIPSVKYSLEPGEYKLENNFWGHLI